MNRGELLDGRSGDDGDPVTARGERECEVVVGPLERVRLAGTHDRLAAPELDQVQIRLDELRRVLGARPGEFPDGRRLARLVAVGVECVAPPALRLWVDVVLPLSERADCGQVFRRDDCPVPVCLEGGGAEHRGDRAYPERLVGDGSLGERDIFEDDPVPRIAASVGNVGRAGLDITVCLGKGGVECARRWALVPVVHAHPALPVANRPYQLRAVGVGLSPFEVDAPVRHLAGRSRAGTPAVPLHQAGVEILPLEEIRLPLDESENPVVAVDRRAVELGDVEALVLDHVKQFVGEQPLVDRQVAIVRDEHHLVLDEVVEPTDTGRIVRGQLLDDVGSTVDGQHRLEACVCNLALCLAHLGPTLCALLGETLAVDDLNLLEHRRVLERETADSLDPGGGPCAEPLELPFVEFVGGGHRQRLVVPVAVHPAHHLVGGASRVGEIRRRLGRTRPDSPRCVLCVSCGGSGRRDHEPDHQRHEKRGQEESPVSHRSCNGARGQ